MEENSNVVESVVSNDILLEISSKLDVINNQLNILDYVVLLAFGLIVAGVVVFILYKVVSSFLNY